MKKSGAIHIVDGGEHVVSGSVSPSVMMEVGLAFYISESIDVLYVVPRPSHISERVFGVGADILNSDVKVIS